MSQQAIPCTPLPPRAAEGEFIFFVYVSNVPPKNVLKGKPVLSRVIQVNIKRVFHYIHSNKNLKKLFYDIE